VKCLGSVKIKERVPLPVLPENKLHLIPDVKVTVPTTTFFFYYIDKSVLEENRPLVKFIRNSIQD